MDLIDGIKPGFLHRSLTLHISTNCCFGDSLKYTWSWQFTLQRWLTETFSPLFPLRSFWLQTLINATCLGMAVASELHETHFQCDCITLSPLERKHSTLCRTSRCCNNAHVKVCLNHFSEAKKFLQFSFLSSFYWHMTFYFWQISTLKVDRIFLKTPAPHVVLCRIINVIAVQTQRNHHVHITSQCSHLAAHIHSSYTLLDILLTSKASIK